MKKAPLRNGLLDKLHRGSVLVCLGVTLIGTSYLAMRGYRYLTVVRPEIKKMELSQKQHLLSEGSHENLKDTAENIAA